MDIILLRCFLSRVKWTVCSFSLLFFFTSSRVLTSQELVQLLHLDFYFFLYQKYKICPVFQGNVFMSQIMTMILRLSIINLLQLPPRVIILRRYKRKYTDCADQQIYLRKKSSHWERRKSRYNSFFIALKNCVQKTKSWKRIRINSEILISFLLLILHYSIFLSIMYRRINIKLWSYANIKIHITFGKLSANTTICGTSGLYLCRTFTCRWNLPCNM